MKLTCYDIQYMLLIKIYMFIVISCSEIDFQGDQEKFKHFTSESFFSPEKEIMEIEPQSIISLIVFILLDWVIIFIAYYLTSCQINIKTYNISYLFCVFFGCFYWALKYTRIYTYVNWTIQLTFLWDEFFICIIYAACNFEFNNRDTY